jgi:hypothetical protein
LGLDAELFGVVVAMTVVTTLATPPVLSPLVAAARRRAERSEG